MILSQTSQTLNIFFSLAPQDTNLFFASDQCFAVEMRGVLQLLNNLAFVVHEQGQYQRAEELYQRALGIYE